MDKKEIASIIVVILILALSVSIRNFNFFLYALAAITAIIVINLIAKNIASHLFESKIETKIWEVERYGFSPQAYFKKSKPFGAFLPIITSIASLGFFTWMGALVFDVKPKISRAAKRHGLYSFSEMTEAHIGYIAAAGILANFVFAVIGYLIGFPEFTKLSIFYICFNIIPMSDLDGNKIFFGNLVLWSFLAALAMVGLGYVFLIV